jgi:hypothetical protein
MTGSVENDPADGKAVAGSIFIAVAVYAVCFATNLFPSTTAALN